MPPHPPTGAGASSPLYHYVIVRRDLPLGFQAAQVVHAAGESSPGNLPSGTFAVVLAVRDEAALGMLEARLRAGGAPVTAIREDDAPYHGSLTALGLRPAPRGTYARWLAALPLLR